MVWAGAQRDRLDVLNVERLAVENSEFPSQPPSRFPLPVSVSPFIVIIIVILFFFFSARPNPQTL
ncbi:hypothetical protein F4780DRAFT_721888 [Xylariomycetidae sp. FL0641]|nr:hypothetical protein F4780DRAFT_721888 [Xylariomycetidae sp. FL0641]